MISDAKTGDSIAVDGICLTITALGTNSFEAIAGAETLRRTAIRDRRSGDTVNLEPAITMQTRLGGHMVQGHVDCTGKVLSVEQQGISQLWRFSIDPTHAHLLITKGSVCVDGISLTVVDCDQDSFSVSVIPQTLDNTALPQRPPGTLVNIETDMIGRYVYSFTQQWHGMKPLPVA